MNSWSKHHRPGFSSLVVALLAMSAGGVPAAAEILPGPVLAEVVEIIDGDTLAVRARIWLDQTIEARVRLSGIDAPELRGRCAAERHAAVEARALLAALTEDRVVTLHDVKHDKYGGRILARVADSHGRDLGGALLGAGLAARYDGGRRQSWCELAEGGRGTD